MKLDIFLMLLMQKMADVCFDITSFVSATLTWVSVSIIKLHFIAKLIL